jgi:putative ATP-binding cassette transporter
MTLLLLIWKQSRAEILRFLRFATIAAFSLTYCYYLINNSSSNTLASDQKIYIVIQFLLTLFIYCFSQLKALELSGPIVENTVHAIRSKLIAGLQKMELQDAESIGTARIISVLSSDTQTISQVASPLAFSVQSLIMTIFAVMYLGFISITGLILAVVISGFAIWSFLSHSKAVEKALTSAQNQASEMQQQVMSLVEGFKELKLSKEKANDAVTSATQSSAASIEYKLVAHKAISQDFVLSQLSIFSLLGTMAFVVPYFNPDTSDNIKESIAAVMFLVSPLFGLIGNVPTITAANLSANNLVEFESLLKSMEVNETNIDELNTTNAIMPTGAVNGVQNDLSFTRLTMENVRFAYNAKDGFSIGPLDFTINQGDLVFVSGNNGAGKTTILKILIGLYRPSSGLVLLDSKPVWPENITQYRNLFAVVFSDFYLFKKLYGVNSLDSAWAQTWLERLQLSKKVELINGQFSTTKLSTGQRKRLALFAALAEKKPILILDEWAADQDPGYRHFFYHEILPYIRSENITVIAITHDDSYYDLADRRLHLKDGVLAQVYKK